MSIAEPSPSTRSPYLDQPTLDSLSFSASAPAPTMEGEDAELGNPLNEFAQQVLGVESDSDAHNLLDLGRSEYAIINEEQTFNDLLQNQNHQQEHGGHEIDPGLENELSRQFTELDESQAHHEHHDEGDARDQETVQSQNQVPTLVYGGRISKRRRVNGHPNDNGDRPVTEDIITDADGNPVGPHEYVRLKKDSHKEVERRRREGINEGINEIAQLIPGGTDKQGKGTVLKKAVAYIIELSDKLRADQEELTKKDIEKQDLEAQLAHLQRQMQEERDRSMRFETSWREAEDRAASSNFEVERIRDELEQLKSSQGQGQ
ncbi:hypothetical protein I302_106892 [Kwoniella bestiolae CBS 10118]|uniref:BHLH domain-containing protein n=1 Tax=Kwoniella bestiolae CBS 10118 TaxID=1296100 RepID=A0A1B9G042_9TREE|nr:hypothetical protein I302_05842 [Kwoniella bestiolae CBS 10118]OCF24382.1 hypothetical protein I302_05842 [Kwoniella bestiolae CBS 10118]